MTEEKRVMILTLKCDAGAKWGSFPGNAKKGN